MQLLRDKGFEPEIVEYLKAPLGQDALAELCRKLEKTPSQIIRKKEALYSTLELDNKNSVQLLTAISENPVLLERPIIVCGQKAVIGRPPENILTLI